MDEVIQRIRHRLSTGAFGGDADEKDIEQLLNYLAKALFLIEKVGISDVDLDAMTFRVKPSSEWIGVYGIKG